MIRHLLAFKLEIPKEPFLFSFSWFLEITFTTSMLISALISISLGWEGKLCLVEDKKWHDHLIIIKIVRSPQSPTPFIVFFCSFWIFLLSLLVMNKGKLLICDEGAIASLLFYLGPIYGLAKLNLLFDAWVKKVINYWWRRRSLYIKLFRFFVVVWNFKIQHHYHNRYVTRYTKSSIGSSNMQCMYPELKFSWKLLLS